MKKTLCPLLGLLFFASCSKSVIDIKPVIKAADDVSANESAARGGKESPNNYDYTNYTILRGEHYCVGNIFKAVTLSQMNFVVRFDSSAIYKSVDPVNQYDINKLYGFSEGFDHQYNSARIGWSWNEGALRLYAYAYNKGVRESTEIAKVPIDADVTCSIVLAPYSYIFNVNGNVATLPRAGNTPSTFGYRLYPYFGGDEVAPHNIYISIANL